MYEHFEITKREVIVSFIIIFILMFFEFFISVNISNYTSEKNELYYTALKIDNNREQFEYAMKTNIGNSMVYGDIKTVDPVSISDLNGKYLGIEKLTERYTRHHRTETYKTLNGHSSTRVVTYYTWDSINNERWKANNVKFIGVKFPISVFNFSAYQILELNKDTVSGSLQDKIHNGKIYKDGQFFENDGDIRYSYSVIPAEFSGTAMGSLKDNTMKLSESFYKDKNTQEVINNIKRCEKIPVIIFRVLWNAFIVICVISFVYLDNKWLEDKK